MIKGLMQHDYRRSPTHCSEHNSVQVLAVGPQVGDQTTGISGQTAGRSGASNSLSTAFHIRRNFPTMKETQSDNHNRHLGKVMNILHLGV